MISHCLDSPKWWGERDRMAWHLVSQHRSVLCLAGGFPGATGKMDDAGPASDIET